MGHHNIRYFNVGVQCDRAKQIMKLRVLKDQSVQPRGSEAIEACFNTGLQSSTSALKAVPDEPTSGAPLQSPG